MFLLLGLVPLAACQMESGTCTDAPAIVGTWHYTAAETSPVRATLVGTLTISSASCSAIAGQLSVVQTDASGGTQQLAGPITGEAVDAKSFQFDAYLEVNPRQHLATIAGDTLAGSWVSTDGTQSATGTFGAHRQ